MNKKLIALVICVMTTVVAAAGPHGCPGGGWRGPGGCRPGYHHGGDGWGRGGRNFWPGFIAGVVGGIVGNAISTPTYATTAVVQPTYVQPTYVQPAVAQQVAYTHPAVQQQVVQATGYGYAGVNTNPYPNAPIVAPAGAVVTADQPVAGRTRVWVQGTYAYKQQGNGAYAAQYIPGHYEYQ